MKTFRPIHWPPLFAAGLIIAAYVGCTLLYLMPARESWVACRPILAMPRAMIIVTGCLLAGLYRVGKPHPRINPKYAAWLATTPWRWPMHLPLGPVLFTVEDVVFLLIISALCRWDAQLPWPTAVIPYCLARLVIALTVGVRTGSRPLAAAAGFLVPLLLLFRQNSVILVAVLLLLVTLDTIALRGSLRRFPWDYRPRPLQPQTPFIWPMNRLGPAKPRKPVPISTGTIVAALVGWWLFTALAVIPDLNSWQYNSDGLNALQFILLLFALVRIAIYCGFYPPARGARARLAIGKWIDPRYDYVVLAPLAAVMVDYLLPPFLHHAGASLALTAGIDAAVVLAILILAGPTLRDWQLTGHHRILRGFQSPERNQQSRGRPGSLRIE